MKTNRSIGKIVDTGNVPEYSATDEYWKFKKAPQIFFHPNDGRYRKGLPIPKEYLHQINKPDNIAAFLMQHYSIKGFEFGNWTTQEDRQNFMLGMAVSLFDLQHILGFAPHQIGLDGVLSFAYGSRGKPYTSGHFEPTSFVINLTRHSADSFKYRADAQRRSVEYRHALLSRGIQSLVHEYGHALDYYCGRYIEPNGQYCLSGGHFHWNINLKTDYYLAGLMRDIINKICFNEKGKASDYIKRVRKHRSQQYLFQRNEIFARAFEKYINYKMKQKGHFNAFMSKCKYEEGSDKTELLSYYLTDEEFMKVERSFDILMTAIRKSLKPRARMMRLNKTKKAIPAKKKKGIGMLNVSPSVMEGVMSIDDVKQQNFDLIGLKGEWKQLIGDACKPTSFFIYGGGGSGKSSAALLFSQHLTDLGYNVLYVAGEQFATPTFKNLINRMKIRMTDKLKIVRDLHALNPKDFDFVVLDSKDQLEMDLPKFLDFQKKYPEQSPIIVSQSTKTGNYTGPGRWRNVVDVMLLADKGFLKSGMDKNRWGGCGEIKVF